MKVEELLRKAGRGGRFFSVDFIKRTNKSPRHLVGRFGVKKYLKRNRVDYTKPYNFREGLGYVPEEKELVVIYDMVKKGYRMIPLESVFLINKKSLKEFENT